ncbi:MAG: cyanophycinase [Acidobacteria bacterium]|nr:cyanophycinase [Acidobacteriota bacterium]
MYNPSDEQERNVSSCGQGVARTAAIVGLLLALSAGPRAQTAPAVVGPEVGSLVVAGGGVEDVAILQRFLELAGGPDAPIVVIPTAGGDQSYDQSYPGLQAFRALGATDLVVLHATHRNAADTEAFVAPLRRARGVWLSGGRQWRLADAYVDTLAHEALRDVLRRGGVVGGSSAGATILGSYLARGDTASNTVMMGDHVVGFGFLRDTAIDQHLLRRNRQFDLIEVVEAHPELLGIGLDEDTAIVVHGDEFEVIGQSYVAIYDHARQLDSGGRFYFLGAGDRFDLRARRAFRTGQDPGPSGRVVDRPWP